MLIHDSLLISFMKYYFNFVVREDKYVISVLYN